MLQDRRWLAVAVLNAAVGLGGCGVATAEEGEFVKLPEPRREGPVSVERALAERRSVREFASGPLALAEVAQLLWAAQGITHPRGKRTAPSAGALYPLELYLVAGAVSGLSPGLYRYEPKRHRLRRAATGDLRGPLSRTALEQEWVAEAPAVLVFTAVHARTARKYGRRAPRYVHMEVGHAAQNVYLQAQALGLGTVMVGAFRDRPLHRAPRLGGTASAHRHQRQGLLLLFAE